MADGIVSEGHQLASSVGGRIDDDDPDNRLFNRQSMQISEYGDYTEV